MALAQHLHNILSDWDKKGIKVHSFTPFFIYIKSKLAQSHFAHSAYFQCGGNVHGSEYSHH